MPKLYKTTIEYKRDLPGIQEKELQVSYHRSAAKASQVKRDFVRYGYSEYMHIYRYRVDTLKVTWLGYILGRPNY